MRRIIGRYSIALTASWMLIATSVASAAVKLNGMFTDNMVLQQGKKLPVWGTADNGEQVTVSIQKQKATAVAKDGKWMAWLKPLKAGGPVEMTVSGQNTLTLKNVLIGEVWICSGQSNMQMHVGGTADAAKAIAESANPKLRLYTVPNTTSDTPLDDVKGSWVECGPQTVAGFSAVGYFFGKHLQAALKVPVGLVATSWGGTPAEAWTSKEVLETTPGLKSILDGWARYIKDEYPKNLAEWQTHMDKWKADADKAKAENRKAPNPPQKPWGPDFFCRPCCLYNAMIHPLLPLAIQGAIWYQGESNAGRAHQYRTLFTAMIRNWRQAFGQGDFTFLCVQLAPFDGGMKENNWPELREAQLMATHALKNVGMAVITDLGDKMDIHPRRKAEVGARLALAARGIAYRQRIVYSGPEYAGMKIHGDKIVLGFNHIGGGLVAQGGDLKGFTLAGKDQKFVPAEAKIEGKTIVVSSPDVKDPVAVRFAWLNYPEVNLFNKEGLPATPFRTDDFPMITKR
jgi:sialate O-acetylesterase